MPPEPVDLLIEARWVLPMAPVNTVLTGHAVAISSAKIVGVGPLAEMNQRFDARDRVVRRDHALLPGFVNAHTRAAMTLLRGLPVRGPRSRWERDIVRPVEQRCMSADFVREGTQLAVAEMLRAGITSFADMYLFPEEAARVASAVRMRAAIGLPVADAPNVWADSATAHFERAEQLWDEYKSDRWVCLYFAPQNAAEVSDETLIRVRRVADELDARIAMRSPPLHRLHALGLLRPGFVAIAHTALARGEAPLISSTGISMVACLQGDLRLGATSWRGALGAESSQEDSGIFSEAMAAAAVRDSAADGYQGSGLPAGAAVGIGGVAIHVTPSLLSSVVGLGSGEPPIVGAVDILSEARMAGLMGFSALEALRLATLGGATALGFSNDIGSIEAGKYADLICIDLRRPACQPTANVPDSILFGATREQVSDVWTSGRQAVSDGHLLGFDEDELTATAQKWLTIGGAT